MQHHLGILFRRAVRTAPINFVQLLNRALSLFKEIPEELVSDYLSILEQKYGFTSKTVLRKHDDIPESHQKILVAISYVGCYLSAGGLTLTILTIALSR